MSSIARFFRIEEYIPKKVFDEYGISSWMFLRPEMVAGSDLFRKRYGPTIINDWLWGGSYHYSGYRPAYTKIGAPNSSHRHGGGFDAKPQNISASEALDDILKNQKLFRQAGITTVLKYKKKRNYVHLDSRWLPFMNLADDKLWVIQL